MHDTPQSRFPFCPSACAGLAWHARSLPPSLSTRRASNAACSVKSSIISPPRNNLFHASVCFAHGAFMCLGPSSPAGFMFPNGRNHISWDLSPQHRHKSVPYTERPFEFFIRIRTGHVPAQRILPAQEPLPLPATFSRLPPPLPAEDHGYTAQVFPIIPR